MGKTVLHDIMQKGENILYIIGNGFDLAHNMKTSYEDFHQFLIKQKEFSAICRLERLYHFKNTDGKWCNIENALGGVSLEDAIKYDIDFQECPAEINSEDSSHDAYRCGENIRNVVSILPGLLLDWANSIETNKIEQKFELPKEAKYLSFNYTETLEDVYGIDSDNVFHIHETINTNKPLVIGYGDAIFENDKYNPDNDEVDVTKIKNLLSQCRKPVREILSEQWFKNLGNISSIIVYGYSCSQVDKPYFEKIAECIKSDAQWEFHVHNEKDKPHFEAFAENIKKENQKYIIINQ